MPRAKLPESQRSSASGLSDDHGRLHSAPFPAAKLASCGPSKRRPILSRVPDPLKVVLGASYGVLVARRREVYPQACVIQGSYPRRKWTPYQRSPSPKVDPLPALTVAESGPPTSAHRRRKWTPIQVVKNK